MVKIVLLDVDDTLLDFYQCSLLSLRKTFQACQLEFKDEYYPIFKEINDELWRQLERKEITKEELFSTRFQLIFDALGLKGDEQKARNVFKEQLDDSYEVIPHAKDLLEYLSKEYHLYVVSNSSEKRQLNRLTKAGFIHYFRDIYTSEKMNAIKPEQAFFDACFQEMNYPDKNDVVLIGDSLTADIQGAIQYGIKPIWFHQGKEDIDVIQVESLLEIKKYL
ncbi:MAG: YjjG family noncanonical pyrimidine nucleotidase [Faecalibacillus sp.]